MATAQIKHRNLALQVLLFIVTFGLYSVYWFYQTGHELKNVTRDEAASPTLWTVLLFVPLVSLYSIYKYAELFEKASSEKFSKWILFLLWLCFVPAAWFVVQSDLNQKARAQTLPLTAKAG